jgi:hypothetical protein
VRRATLLGALLLAACFEAIEHTPDSGATDAGAACSTAACPCAQECGGAEPKHCVPVAPAGCDVTTHCEVVLVGSSCSAVFRLGALCGYHACLLPDGGS